MADTISVIIGAQIDGLLAGVAEAKASIEGLRKPIDDFVGDLRGISEAVGAAFAIEKIKEFAAEMAEMGERTANMAYVMGQSVGDLAQFQSMMTLAGENADEAGQSLQRFARFVQNVEEGNKRAIATLHNFGISEDEVKQHGDNLLDILHLMVQRAADTQGSFRLLGVLSEEFGRGVMRLAGFIREAGESWDELARRSQTFREAMERNNEGMLDSARSINELKDGLNTLEVDAFGALKPAIDASVASMRYLVDQFKAALTPIDDAKNGIDDFGRAIRNFIQGIRDVASVLQILGDVFDHLMTEMKTWGAVTHEIFVGVFNMIKALVLGGDIEAAFAQMMNNIAAIVKKGGDNLVAIMQDAVNRIKAIAAGAAAPLSDINLPPVDVQARRIGRPLGTEGPEGRGRKAKDTTKQDYEAFAEEMRLEIAEADKDWNQISAIYDKWAAHAKEVFGDQSKEYRQVLLEMTRAHQQHIQQMFQQEEQWSASTRQIDESYMKQFEQNMEEMVKKHQISKRQMYGFDIQYATQLHELERKQLEDMIQNDNFTVEQKRRVYQQLMELDARYTAQVTGFQQKATPDFGGVSQSIAGALSSAIMSVATRQETPGQAMAKLLEDAMQHIMSSLFEKLIQQTITNLFTQLAADAGNTGILATLLSILVGENVFHFQSGGIVPSARSGWVVPSFQGGGILAQLHSNEMVLPSHISQAVQNMAAGGGGGGSTINIHAIDTQSGGQFLMRNAGSVGQAALRYSNVSPRAVSSGGARFP